MLNKLRKEIDKIDHEIIRLLGERFKVVDKIGEYKKSNDMDIIQPKRWEELMTDRMVCGKNHGLDDLMIKDIWEIIHRSAIRKESS